MNDKIVLITGASRGIGRATAIAFAKEGYKIAANYFSNKEKAEELKNEIEGFGGVCSVFRADVSDEAQVISMVNGIEGTLGNISILINNAGIASQELFTDTTSKQWKHIFSVNTDGAFHCTKAVLPHMIHEKSGRIVNIASMWGEVGGSCEVAYSASKGAIIAFTKALSKELALSGITVNCVSPGMIDTDMNSFLSESDRLLVEEEIPLGYSGRPEDVAQAVLFLCKASYITGQIIRVNGGLVV